MIELEGKFNKAKVFTDLIEETAIGQVIEMLSHEITEGTQVRIMPDVHAGKGSTIGTTIKLAEDFADWKVCPNVVGVDVGCGILMYKLGKQSEPINLADLDEKVNKLIPSGFTVHQKGRNYALTDKLVKGLTLDLPEKTIEHIHKSLGTLGGGNHFIELGLDGDGNYWLSVHSGSRNLGVQVAKTHQEIAVSNLKEKEVNTDEVIAKLKAEGRHSEIQATLKKLGNHKSSITVKGKDLAYLQGQELKDYLNDMTLAQEYAAGSRKEMLDIIVKAMNWTVVDQFDSVHNFIEHDNFRSGTIRKGATSAKEGERLVIPLNMRDGSLICIGKGNEDWNNSAPHGAGRMMSRAQAKREIDMETFTSQMTDVYSSSVLDSTLDEAPDAYKPAESILENIKATADVLHIVKPVYNFKAH